MQNLLNRVVKYSIYALVFFTPLFWLPFSFEAFEYSKQYLIFFLTSLAFFAWILKQVLYDKEIKFRKSRIDYLVLGFLSVSIISAIFSADNNSSVFGLYGRFSDGLIGLLSLAAFYFLITNNAHIEKTGNVPQKEKRSPKITGIVAAKLLNLFLYSTGIIVFVSYLSIFRVWQKIDFLPQVMLQRTFNPLAGSLEGLAVFLAALVALLAGLLLNKSRSIFYWILLLTSLGLMVIVDFTPSWIILLATLVLFVGVSLAKRIFKESANQLLIPIILIIIAAAFIFLQPVKMNLPQEQILPQAVSWQVAFNSATDNFKSGFIGSGIGTFHYDFAAHKPQSFNQNWMWQIRFDRAGSYFSELLATVGFLGFLLYLGLIGLVLLISWFFITKQFSSSHLIIAFFALLAGQLVYYQNTSLSFMFWLILGLLAVSWQTAEPIKEKKFSFKNFPELSLMILTLIIIFGAVLLSLYFYAIKYYLADLNYSKALTASAETRIKGLEKAVGLNPQFAPYRTVLSMAYLTQILDEMQKSANDQDTAKIQSLVAKAIEQARVATVLEPNQVVYWENLGVIYREIQGIAAGANEWGVKSFEQAIKLEPVNPALRVELGKLYLAAGNKEKARENFDKALEKKPDYVSATVQLALLLEQDDILDEAVAKLENLVRNNPYHVESRFQLGRLYFNYGRIDEAIGQFQAVTILAPNHSNAHYSLGVAYAAKKDTQSAIEEFEKVLELNPGNQDIMQKIRTLKGE